MLYSVDDTGKLSFVSKLDIAQKKETGSLRWAALVCIIYRVYSSIIRFHVKNDPPNYEEKSWLKHILRVMNEGKFWATEG